MGMHPVTLCVTSPSGADAERPGRHSHAERGNDRLKALFNGFRRLAFLHLLQQRCALVGLIAARCDQGQQTSRRAGDHTERDHARTAQHQRHRFHTSIGLS
ncbi:hypothetical protein DJ480_10640 [Pseudomonas sp. Leaf98]|nr:hypothetical protein DJ480_10640 [Pseudomonas sp. Leaf98]